MWVPRLGRAVVACLSITMAVTRAAADDAAVSAIVVEPVARSRYESVVTGSRTETPISEAPIATEVINRAQLERSGARDVADALLNTTGVQLTRGFSGTQIQMQGLDSQYVLLLVDGQRQIGRVDGGFDLQRFPIDDIERIEIVRGPASALYGADAIGGVINIITRRSYRRQFADGRAQYGSLNQADIRAAGGLRRDNSTIRANVGYHRRDPFRLGAVDGATTGSGFDEIVAGARYDYDVPQRVSVTASVDFLQRTMRGVDVSAAGAVFDRTNLLHTVNVRIASEHTLRIPARLRLTGSYAYFNDQYLSDQRGSNALDTYQRTREQLGLLNLQYDHLLPHRHFVTVGGEAQVEALSSARLTGSGLRQRGAVFLQDQWTLWEAHRLVAVPAMRFEMDSQFGFNFSPKLSLRFDIHPKLVLRASYGRGYRAPSFKELLLLFENTGVGYRVEGNPALRPETSHGENVGFELRAASWLWFSASYFRNDLTNQIVASIVEPGGPGLTTRYQYVNIASSYTQGLETAARLGAWRGVELELGYTLTDSRDNEAKRPLPGRARHAGSFGVVYTKTRWGVSAMVRGAIYSERNQYVDNADGSYQTLRAPTYVMLDARVSETIKKRITLFIGAQNLAGAGDAQLNQLPPRTFYGGVEGRY